MKFGTKRSDAPETEAGSGNYLRSFRKGETKVRFLEEPSEWIVYQEHFTADNKSFPCTGDTSMCPGCTSDSERTQRRSRKYGTYLFLVKNNQTLPFKIPVSLSNRLQSRAERNGGTLLNRDYVIVKTGTGLETDYDVDQEEKYPVDLKDLMSKLGTGNVEEILEEQFRENWGDPAQYERAEEPKTKAKAATKPTPSPIRTKDEEDLGFDLDTPEGLLSPKELKAKRDYEAKQAAAEKEDELDVTEEQLKAMTRGELVNLWDKAKFEGFDEDWGKADIIDAIILRATT